MEEWSLKLEKLMVSYNEYMAVHNLSEFSNYLSRRSSGDLHSEGYQGFLVANFYPFPFLIHTCPAKAPPKCPPYNNNITATKPVIKYHTGGLKFVEPR